MKGGRQPGASFLLLSTFVPFHLSLVCLIAFTHQHQFLFFTGSLSLSPTLCRFFSPIICIHLGRKTEKKGEWGRAPAQAGLGVLMEKYLVIWVTSLFDAQGWNISSKRDCVSHTHTERRCGCSRATGLLLCKNTNHLHTKHIGHRDVQLRC